MLWRLNMENLALILSRAALGVAAVQRPAAGLLREASAGPPAAQRCAEKGEIRSGEISKRVLGLWLLSTESRLKNLNVMQMFEYSKHEFITSGWSRLWQTLTAKTCCHFSCERKNDKQYLEVTFPDDLFELEMLVFVCFGWNKRKQTPQRFISVLLFWCVPC